MVAVPGQGFFHTNPEVSNGNCNYQKRYIRFAYCKSDATLAAVAEGFGKILNARGHLVLFDDVIEQDRGLESVTET